VHVLHVKIASPKMSWIQRCILSTTIVHHFKSLPASQSHLDLRTLVAATTAPADDCAALPFGPNDPGAFEAWKPVVGTGAGTGAGAAIGADVGGRRRGGGGALEVAGASAFDGGSRVGAKKAGAEEIGAGPTLAKKVVAGSTMRVPTTRRPDSEYWRP
jgi:hypothetical protein